MYDIINILQYIGKKTFLINVNILDKITVLILKVFIITVGKNKILFY